MVQRISNSATCYSLGIAHNYVSPPNKDIEDYDKSDSSQTS